MSVEDAILPEKIAGQIVFDLEERGKRGDNLLYLNSERYLASWGIDMENSMYGKYQQFLMRAKILIGSYQRAQRGVLLPEPPLRFGSVLEIRHRENAKIAASQIIENYPQVRRRLIMGKNAA